MLTTTNQRRLRALVVDDSVTVRERLKAILASDKDIEVVGEAGDGQRAIELCAELRPDVVTLDMMLPVMTGVAATEYIMAHFPTPILIVSASTNRGELFKTYDALAAGAVDVMEKPAGDEPDGAWEARFVAAVKLVSRIKVITHPRAKLAGVGVGKTPPSAPSALGDRRDAHMLDDARGTPGAARQGSLRAPKIIAIGASTGGPGALVEVLRQIPAGFGVPIVFVLHIDEPFGAAFAEWLEGQTRHRVVYPASHAAVADFAGRVVMAQPGRHLVIRGGRFHFTNDAERHSCRPSIDVLFESVAAEYRDAGIACLLTGMGRDGAAGLLEIRRAGGHTIAQDEATSVVYGMPREAALLDAAVEVLPLGAIGGTLAALLGPAWRMATGAKA